MKICALSESGACEASAVATQGTTLIADRTGKDFRVRVPIGIGVGRLLCRAGWLAGSEKGTIEVKGRSEVAARCYGLLTTIATVKLSAAKGVAIRTVLREFGEWSSA